MSKNLFGKIFISYSVLDKIVARQVAKKLATHGYTVWLDEMNLNLGDKLPKEIGEALSSSRVIVLLISKNSLTSPWFEYESNMAVERMIKDKLRLIPILIDDSQPPKTLRSLVYGNLKKSPQKTWKQILSVLDSEYKAFEFSFGANKFSKYAREVFGSIGFSFVVSSEPFSKGGEDWENVYVKNQDREYEIYYTELRGYSKKSTLNRTGWSNYLEMIEARGYSNHGQYSLLVTNYKLDRSLKDKLVKVHPRLYSFSGNNLPEMHLILDLSGIPHDTVLISTFKKAKKALEKYIAQNE